MKIAIIIVNWNTGELLAQCLRSLQALPVADRDVVAGIWVVDNASADDSVARARSVAEDQSSLLSIQFITNAVNVGFARANNQVISEVVDRTVPCHVLLLNPDTEVHAGALPALLAVFDQHADVGIVGPKLLNPNGTLQGSVRPFPVFADFILYMLKLGRLIQSAQENAYDYSRPGYVDQVMGAAFLIRQPVIAELGGLDPGFFTLFEEVDFARRAQEKGWRTYYTPAATIMHVKAASFKQLVGWRKSLPWLKSSLRYARKHLSTWQVAALYALVPLSVLLILPASLKHLVIKHVH